MRIVLLRHGKPDVPEHGKLRAHEIPRWIESYNSSGIALDHEPPQEAIKIAKSCNTVVCSDLPRSTDSAQALGVKRIDIVEPVFREMGLPYTTLPSPKLSPNIWAAIFRVLWLFGYSSNGESISEAKDRAGKGAHWLSEMAMDSGSVLLVGHGFVNRFIAKELKSNGWQGPRNPGKQFWEFGVYEYAT